MNELITEVFVEQPPALPWSANDHYGVSSEVTKRWRFKEIYKHLTSGHSVIPQNCCSMIK